MNTSHSSNCIVSDQFQLWIKHYLAKQLFDIDTITDIWVMINNLPPIIQVYNFYPTIDIHSLIALTVSGQLLIIDSNHPNGTLINCSVKSIKYIDIWEIDRNNSQSILMIIDEMNRIYTHDIQSLIEGRNQLISPKLLGKNVTSLAYIDTKCGLWLCESEDNTYRSCIFGYDGTRVTKIETPCEPYRLIDQFLIDVHNSVYKININRIESSIHFNKILHIDYEVRSMINHPNYHDLSIIDDEGLIHIYITTSY